MSRCQIDSRAPAGAGPMTGTAPERLPQVIEERHFWHWRVGAAAATSGAARFLHSGVFELFNPAGAYPKWRGVPSE